MDERFTLLSKVPESALKRIEAGRLKNKSDINAQWRICGLTEVYGLCGEGWKETIEDVKEYSTPDGQLMVFMKVSVRYKTKDGQWSEPVYGFGGDFIIKKERDGLHANDEALKMVETDALGNALKKIGVASDVYRGFWDGSKYIRNEETALVKQKEPQPLYKQVEGEYAVLARDGQYHFLKGLTTEQLNALVNSDKYAEIHDAVRQEMSTRNE